MKRLRHPIRAIEEPFGKAGLIVAVIALVLALTGAAFAAAGLTGKQKKEVEKIAKKFAGKPGATGAAGSQGSAGAAGKDGGQGEKGAKGDTGSPGAAGAPGTAGADGKSVEVVQIDTGTSQCEGRGGTEVFIEGEAGEEVCNGKDGPAGPEGKPWTAGGTLPSGAQVTGSWMASGSGIVDVPLSFSIPLASVLSKANVYYGTGEEPEIEKEPGVFEKTPFRQHCNGIQLTPEVAAGFDRTLCVYYNPFTATAVATFEMVTKAGDEGGKGAGAGGGFLKLNITEPGVIYGSFAVSGG
jgi:pilus assembly protein FimV